MDIKVRHTFVHRPENSAAFDGLISGMQGDMQGQDEP
jgi:hypothetical protein